MLDLVPPEQLATYVPGEVLLGSDELSWSDVSLRSYRYNGLDVEVPPLRDFTIVAFMQGRTNIDRRVDDGPWQRESCGPGDVSVMTRAEMSHWTWKDPIDVIHLYLTRQMLAKVCADAIDRDIEDIELRDVLRADDLALNRSIAAIGEEVRTENLGGKLYVEAMTTQVCVHLLRRYANVSVRAPTASGGLSRMQAQLVEGYIEANLDRQLSLEDLAAVAHTSTSHFLRQFKARFGVPPHAYVIQRRVACAQRLLSKTRLPIKDIASQSGFSDQSHMTRVFQRLLQTTPCGYRQGKSG